MRPTLNTLIDKYIDFASQEYFETLMRMQNPSKILSSINPYVGVISYPSDDFLQADLTYKKRVQFQNMTYVGYMEFLLPPVDALSSSGLSYTLLSFSLDNITRRCLQISDGFTISAGVKFKDFILSKFPKCSTDIAFNRNAFHVLTDIEITGGTYLPSLGADPFQLVSSGGGAFTPSIEFEFAISGYKCLLQ